MSLVDEIEIRLRYSKPDKKWYGEVLSPIGMKKLGTSNSLAAIKRKVDTHFNSLGYEVKYDAREGHLIKGSLNPERKY